jgi:hypothetical protein
LCGSTATESASESALRSGDASGRHAAGAPYAPSTWNHNECRWQIAAISASGSMAPVLTEPAVPITMNGV